MAGRECADIVFCVDASDSMRPCLDAVRKNINKLADIFKSDPQRTWDVRLDFIAHAAGNDLFQASSVFFDEGGGLLDALYKKAGREKKFFTTDIEKFKERLAEVKTEGDEATLYALDIALDYPWRPAETCHRSIVLLTDEPVETGLWVEEQRAAVETIIDKVQNKRIQLFLFTPDIPESKIFYEFDTVHKCIFQPYRGGNDGMAKVDFRKLMDGVASSISASQSSFAVENDNPSPSFGQDKWGRSNAITLGDDQILKKRNLQ
jgi:hypothetical protein